MHAEPHPCEANYAPLTPLNFIVRSAKVYGDQPAIIYGDIRRNWRETYERTRRLACAIAAAGVNRGETVAVLLPNIPAMVEVHFGVPMAGAVLNTINIRLDALSVIFILRHADAKVLIIDSEYTEIMQSAKQALPSLQIVSVADIYPVHPQCVTEVTEYENFLASGDPDYCWTPPTNEWDAIALNFTSGTTGQPKGVIYHHRGAYLATIGNILEWEMPKYTVYLWTLPMFHCNGWCFPWAIAARAGVNVCLRKFDVTTVFELIRRETVTHYCGAPIIQNAIADAPIKLRTEIDHTVNTMVAGAAPSSTMITKIRGLGFKLLHVYGLTEVYGPAITCTEQKCWENASDDIHAQLKQRQGVCHQMHAEVAVLDPDTMTTVPADGKTLGEIMIRGNICMKGYLKDSQATDEAFRDGWFHTGDLGVLSTDGYIHLKDRCKDMIISGGENISSIEIEEALSQHPAVAFGAVVAMPDALWGEVPCAFIELRDGVSVTEDEIVAHCRQRLASFKVPKKVYFGKLPTSSTGKILKQQLRNTISTENIIGKTGRLHYKND